MTGKYNKWICQFAVCMVAGSLLMAGCGTPTSQEQQALITPPCLPSAEICDGKDNDCNGVIDDVLLAYKTCLGSCGQGIEVCQGGQIQCGNVKPVTETCNNHDDDCNGKIDNGVPPAGVCTTACGFGTKSCVNGVYKCTAREPKPETCNNQDDDCDGKIDNGLPTLCRIDAFTYGYRLCVAGQWTICRNTVR